MEAELTPLESAINVLEMIKTEFTLTEAVVESSRKLVKEAVRLYFSFFFQQKSEVFEDTVLISFCGVEEDWMKRQQVNTLEHIQTHTDSISSGDPFLAYTWKETLMVGAQLL